MESGIYKWNVISLDNLMRGFYKATMHMFYGNAGIGKTTLAAYVPILRILQEDGYPGKNEKFIVVDGDGSFSYRRLKMILDANNVDSAKVVNAIIRYELSDSFQEQHDLIVKKIPELLKTKKIKPLLITVDPMTNIYRQIVLKTPSQFKLVKTGEYTGKLDQELTVLRALAIDYNCPVFVTTWKKSSIDMSKIPDPEKLPFIGGQPFQFYPKIIAEIRYLGEDRTSPYRELRLWKAKDLPLKTAKFKLSEKGIEDVV